MKLFWLTVFSKYVTFYYANPTEYIDKKIIKIKIDLKNNNWKLIGDISKSFISKLYIKYLLFHVDVGSKNTAICANSAGISAIILNTLNVYILSNYDTKTDFRVNTDYVENHLKFKFNSVIYISLYDVIWAVIIAMNKRYVYGKRC